jgi:hypothetical protein
MPPDPGANRCRIGGSDDTRFLRRRVFPAGPIHPSRGMEAQNRPVRYADPVAGNRAEHEGACREARTVDDNAFPGLTNCGEER